MTYVQPHRIACSISPLGQDDAAMPSTSSAHKKLGEVEEKEVIAIPFPDTQDDVRRPRIGRWPMKPTKEEIEEHLPLHLIRVSWCEFRRSGRG